jgi:hypothetical protein
LGPRIVNVYVVVTAGFTCLLPRGVTGPRLGSIVRPAGFSVCHTNTVDSPGRIDGGRASKVMTRGAGAGRPPRAPAPRAPAAGTCGAWGACANTTQHANNKPSTAQSVLLMSNLRITLRHGNNHRGTESTEKSSCSLHLGTDLPPIRQFHAVADHRGGAALGRRSRA